ncbi:MAG: TolC family protein [Paludibacter sp.]|nr:TolC family protein [Paludibacter sp.]
MKNKKIYIASKVRFIIILCLIMIFPVAEAQKVLSLDDAVSIALKNNFDILVAKNNASIDKVNNTPGNAGMLPTVAVTGTGSYGMSNTETKTPPSIVTNYSNLTSTTLSAGAQLNWNLFDGGKMFVTKHKLAEIQALGEIQFKDQVLQTLFNVIAAYYDVVRQKQQLNSINESLSYNKDRVTISQAGFNAGSALKSDLLQAKIDLNVTTENLINQQYVIDAALKTLNQLLGKKADEVYDTVDSIPLGYAPDKADLLNKINSSNTSILNFQKQINIAQLALKESRSSYLPTLSFRAGYFASQTTNSAGSTLSSSAIGPQVGGTLAIPVYSAGETRRKETVAKIQAQSAEYNLQNIKLQVNTELLNTLTDFENQQKLLNIETDNNQLAKENMQISIDRLKHGQTTSLEVHIAQEDFALSSTRLINFRYNLKLAETKLKQLVSGL